MHLTVLFIVIAGLRAAALAVLNQSASGVPFLLLGGERKAWT